MLSMNFVGIGFILLTFEKGWRFSCSLYNFVYIYIIVFFLIFRLGGIPRKAAKLEEKLKAKAAAMTEAAAKGPNGSGETKKVK
jgi:hypothetical protein